MNDKILLNYVPGDVNGDCYLMGGDITYLVNYFGGSNPPPPDPRSRADANCDGYRTGGDIIYLVNYFSGGPAPKCCFWQCNYTLITYYIYSGDQVIAEYDEDGQLIDNYVYLGRMRLARFNDDLLN